MSRTTRVLSRAATVAMLLLLAASAVMAAGTRPHPEYGTATVDGNTTEWYLQGDHFADMYRDGDCQKTLESKVWMRYDCSSDTLYLLVLAEPGVTLRADEPANQWFKIYDLLQSPLVDGTSGDNGTPPDFQYVGLSGATAQGYEASVSLNPAEYSQIEVYAQVNHDGSQISSTGKTANHISLTIECPTMDLGDLPPVYACTKQAD